MNNMIFSYTGKPHNDIPKSSTKLFNVEVKKINNMQIAKVLICCLVINHRYMVPCFNVFNMLHQVAVLVVNNFINHFLNNKIMLIYCYVK